jgi:hypothetical protein
VLLQAVVEREEAAEIRCVCDQSCPHYSDQCSCRTAQMDAPVPFLELVPVAGLVVVEAMFIALV